MNFEKELKKGNIVFCDYTEEFLPNIVLNKKVGDITIILTKPKYRTNFENENVNIERNSSISEIEQLSVDATFLDRRSIKLLLLKLPLGSKHIFIRIAPRISWLIGFFGLIRRLLNNQVSFGGIVSFKAGSTVQKWLFLKRSKGFVKLLNKKNVPRFDRFCSGFYLWAKPYK